MILLRAGRRQALIASTGVVTLILLARPIRKSTLIHVYEKCNYVYVKVVSKKQSKTASLQRFLPTIMNASFGSNISAFYKLLTARLSIGLVCFSCKCTIIYDKQLQCYPWCLHDNVGRFCSLTRGYELMFSRKPNYNRC